MIFVVIDLENRYFSKAVKKLVKLYRVDVIRKAVDLVLVRSAEENGQPALDKGVPASCQIVMLLINLFLTVERVVGDQDAHGRLSPEQHGIEEGGCVVKIGFIAVTRSNLK